MDMTPEEYKIYWKLPIEEKKKIYALELAKIVDKRPHLFKKENKMIENEENKEKEDKTDKKELDGKELYEKMIEELPTWNPKEKTIQY